MYELITLGAPDLRRIGDRAHAAGRVELTARPKQLALLVYLAAQNGALCRRDRLLPLLWAEADEGRARNALSQTLRRIRLSLGMEVVHTAGVHEVGIEPAHIDLDVIRFRSAAAQGDWSRAYGLYRGDFMAGFHVRGAALLDRWIEDERRELRARGLEVVLRHSEDLAGRVAVRDAADVLRSALKIFPAEETLSPPPPPSRRPRSPRGSGLALRRNRVLPCPSRREGLWLSYPSIRRRPT